MEVDIMDAKVGTEATKVTVTKAVVAAVEGKTVAILLLMVGIGELVAMEKKPAGVVMVVVELAESDELEEGRLAQAALLRRTEEISRG
jgi:hypothetical protein